MIVFGALMPHPPIIIPEVGGSNLLEAQATVQGMKELSQEVSRHQPETLVFITPHGNVFSDALSVLTGRAAVQGDLGAFGHPEVKSQHPCDPEFERLLLQQASAEKIQLVGVSENLARAHGLKSELDHGILVPLYYLDRAGLTRSRVVAISYGLLPRERLYTFGTLVARVAELLGRRAAIIASGDMSHRLKHKGPYSFHPDGPAFDLKIKELLERGNVEEILELPEPFVENAGECGYRSIIILMGALEGRAFASRVFSYEGPFGVGYLTAGFVPGEPESSRQLLPRIREKNRKEVEARRKEESPIVRWARSCLEAYIKKRERLEPWPELPEELKKPAGAFVSLKKGGQLRGCIGTIMPTQDNLALEIRENAISSGTRDYRFLPVTEGELEELVYSVDVLSPPEPVSSKEELDPKKYGIIVRSGGRTGVLLPDLEGVDTVDQQINIALQKAGIRPDEPYEIERFSVTRYR